RAIRILPPYYVALILSLLVLPIVRPLINSTPYWNLPKATWIGTVLHFCLLQDLWANVTREINGALWSISVEWRIYLFFPILLWIWRRYGVYAVLGTTSVISTILCVTLPLFGLSANSSFGVGMCPQYL